MTFDMSQKKNLKIKDWALEDRPREKLLSMGINSLTDAELIAIIIGSGNNEESAVEVSKKILKQSSNNLGELSKATIKELIKFKGIGEVKAINIVVALELGRRNNSSEVLTKNNIGSSKEVYQLFQAKLGHLQHEEFWVLYMNRSNKIISQLKISQGGISGTVADVRIILKHAIEKLASAIILVHNHPSGNIQASKSDIEITKKMKEAAKSIDINVLDHIIVSDKGYYSFADEGQM